MRVIELTARDDAGNADIGIERHERRRLKLRHDVQELGYARADSLAHAGFSSLAAPVFDHERRLAGAITLLGLSANFAANTEGRLSQVLMLKTRQLSFQLGARP